MINAVSTDVSFFDYSNGGNNLETDTMIIQLRKFAKEHENDKTFTGKVIVSVMCDDVANRLEDQLVELNTLRHTTKELKNQLDDALKEIEILKNNAKEGNNYE